MEWKRELHASRGTTLVEVYQDEIWSVDLSSLLEARLATAGVDATPLSTAQIGEIAQKARQRVGGFTKLVVAFLKLFRAGAWSRSEVSARAVTPRDVAFLKLFWPLLDAYENSLAEEGKIDFEEMLLFASRHLEGGTDFARYRYILVDEFQDMSRARVELLKALRGEPASTRLFLVGDDWQSIYRFTGADISFFTNVETHFGPTARTDLDRTFRLTPDVAAASRKFITRNPAQFPKKLEAGRRDGTDPAVSVRFYEQGHEAEALGATLEEIAARDPAAGDVLVLARYNHLIGDVARGNAEAIGGGGLYLRPMTMHRAKGLEADNVVVIGMAADSLGFPSQIQDDRVLQLVLSQGDPYPNAEERRLFYVALTRTRRRVYLLADSQFPSSFIQELLEPAYEEWLEVIGEESERHRCPQCRGKTIKRREGRYGTFWGCINYAQCRGKLYACRLCGSGALQGPEMMGAGWFYTCTECSERVEACPRCHRGILMKREGPYPPFLSCSTWRRDGSGCAFKRNL